MVEEMEEGLAVDDEKRMRGGSAEEEEEQWPSKVVAAVLLLFLFLLVLWRRCLSADGAILLPPFVSCEDIGLCRRRRRTWHRGATHVAHHHHHSSGLRRRRSLFAVSLAPEAGRESIPQQSRMAGGRRSNSRSMSKPGTGATSAAAGSLCTDDATTKSSAAPDSTPALHHASMAAASTSGGPAAAPTCPSHLAPTSFPEESKILFETLVLFYAMLTLALQYLHLYRTVWWLPHSYTKYALNMHLVNVHLGVLVMGILGRRLAWLLARRLALFLWPELFGGRCRALWFLRLGLATGLGCILLFCALPLLRTHPLLSIFYLSYPVAIYVVLFSACFSGITTEMKEKVQQANIRSGSHCCLAAPSNVRLEVERLKIDFNARLRHCLFEALLSAYYAAFVPCAFAPPHLHYDVYFATQHLIFSFGGAAALQVAHYFPPSYCQELHRWALHLGTWTRLTPGAPLVPGTVVSGSNAATGPPPTWNQESSWQKGTVVRHYRELYRSKSRGCTAAEPGNPSHTRFYQVFGKGGGFSVQKVAVMVQMLVVGGQLTVILRSHEWHHVLSISLLLFLNYYALFRLARDYLLLSKLHDYETTLLQRATTATSNATPSS